MKKTGVDALRRRYEALVTQSEELAFLGTRGLALLSNLMRPDAPSAVKG
jgi:hypothetical protein